VQLDPQKAAEVGERVKAVGDIPQIAIVALQQTAGVEARELTVRSLTVAIHGIQALRVVRTFVVEARQHPVVVTVAEHQTLVGALVFQIVMNLICVKARHIPSARARAG
jgi:hypothetical protein